MTLNDYMDLALRTAAPGTEHETLTHAALGLAGEAGEFADAVKRQVVYGRPHDRENLKEEIGDLLWYCALAADAIGVSLNQIARENIDKLRTRYPEKFTRELAAARLDKEST